MNLTHLARSALALGTLGIAEAALARDCLSQTLRGKITVRSTGEPVPSAIVALLDSADRVVATTLADDHGTFVIAAPAVGRYRARAERVGYRGTSTSFVTLATGDTLDLPIAMPGESVSLRAVRVTADRQCVIRPHEGLAAAQLWDEARKALRATELTQMAQATARQRRDPHRFTMRLRRFVRILDPETLAERRMDSYDSEGESVTPFTSRAPELLARDGYLQTDSDGASTYYAPDAPVLLSDGFLDTHCFRVQAAARGREDLIGLAFEPVSRAPKGSARGEQHVDVRGVLWLHRATAELRYMDFRYANLQLEVPTNHVGGQIEFRPLPDGRWVAWRWYIRMPRVEQRRADFDFQSARVGGSRLVLGAIQEEGAEVLEVLPPGSRRVGVASVSGVVYDSLRPGPLAGVRVFLSGTSLSALTGPDGRYRIESVPPGAYNASMLTTRLDSLLLDPPVQRLTVSAGVETQADFGIPSATSLFAQWCPGLTGADTLGAVRGIVRDTSNLLAAGSTVAAQWDTFSKVHGDKLAIRPYVAQSVTLTDGRYALCGLPFDTRVTLRAAQGKNQHATAELKLLPGEVRRVDLSLKAR